MSTYRFQRDGAEWSREEWRALDRALHRWVRVHGGSERLAAIAAWASLADGDGDAALPLAGGDRYAMLPLTPAEIAGLRAEPLVASDPASEVRPFVLDAANRFYLWRNYQQEREAAALIRARRAAATPAGAAAAIEADLDVLFRGDRRAELDAQRQAVRRVAGRRLFVLTGGPGTGKTTTVLRMLLMLQRRATAPLSIRIAAPTGKAAQRLVQALRQGKLDLRNHAAAPLPAEWLPLLDAIPDADALTVHRLLGYEPWRNAFRRNAHDPIAADVVVIDEASMIDLDMLRSLLGALKPETTLILVGDADQLTSVATGSVLMDIVAALERGAGADLVRLDHSFRAQRHLVALNEAVRTGDAAAVAEASAAAPPDAIVSREIESAPQLAERLARWAHDLAATGDLKAALPAADGAHATSPSQSTADARAQCVRAALAALARRQLLCALREGPFGALNANAMIERALRKAWHVGVNVEWYAGRAVIVTRNDYAAGLFNGDVGICLADGEGHLRVWFEASGGHAAVRAFAPNTLPVHEGAFAITIHKSQGSEYDCAAVLLPPDSENRILSRQLLYTAVSRARHGVELWAAPAALETALRRPIARQGGLRERLIAFEG